jgi:major membrane immunogen (membrane-anchored lipoprotein)
MIKHLRLGLFIILVGLLMTACKFSYTEPSEKSTGLSNNSSFLIAKKSLRYIQENKTDSLKGLLNSKVLKMTKLEQIDWLIREGKIVLDNYEYPNDTSVLKSQQTNYSVGGKQLIEMFSFPFHSKVHKDSVKYFHVTIADNEIYKLLLNDYPPGMRIIEPKHSEPHKDKLNMQTDNLKWFRIWYDGGAYNKKRYKNENGFYAVSGGKEKLEEIGIKDKFQELFNLINTAKFDSLDFNFLGEAEVGEPEWIYLRLRFNNEEYNNLGEFEVSYFIKEEQGKKEIMSDYIIFKHTDKTRYLMRKDTNQEIVKILTDIAHFDYGDYYERYP